MNKVLSLVEAFFNGLSGFAKANPALAAAAVNVVVALLARFGFHASATQLTELVSVLTVLLGGLVHVNTRPASAGDHQKS